MKAHIPLCILVMISSVVYIPKGYGALKLDKYTTTFISFKNYIDKNNNKIIVDDEKDYETDSFIALLPIHPNFVYSDLQKAPKLP